MLHQGELRLLGAYRVDGHCAAGAAASQASGGTQWVVTRDAVPATIRVRVECGRGT